MRHLPQDLASASVIGHVVVDFDAPIHGPRVHDDAVRRQAHRTPMGQAVVLAVVRGDPTPRRTLQLHSKHHDDVKFGENRIKIVCDRHKIMTGGNLGERPRKQRGGAHQPHGRPERRQGMDGTACHAAVGDVPDDGHLHSRNLPEGLADGQAVQQALGGMLPSTVAGVDHGASDVPGQEVGAAGDRRTHHHRVHAERIDVQGRVQEGLALAGAGPDARERQRAPAESGRGRLEAEPGPRRVLEEELRDQLAPQRCRSLGFTARHRDERSRPIKQCREVRLVEPLELQQVPRHVRSVRRARRASAHPPL